MYSNGYAVEDFYNKYPFPQHNESYIRTKSIQLKDLFHKLGIIDTLPHKPLILDAGCGTGTYTNSIALAFPEAKVIGINVSQRSIEYAETQAKNMKLSNVEYFVADIFDLPKNVSLAYYDLVWCSGALHHTHSVKEGIKILSSLGKPNSYFILSLYHVGRWKTFLQRFFRKALRSMLTKAKQQII
mgnify:FL=1|tara:strand:+ start:342 stop:896 length:555 start_codon:yes stop_codon:yes gene_type:complete